MARWRRDSRGRLTADTPAGLDEFVEVPQAPPPAPAMRSATAAAGSPAPVRARPRRRRRGVPGPLLTLGGLVLIVAGLLVIAVPLYGVWQRGRADSRALQDWNAGGAQALVGVAPTAGAARPVPAAATCASQSAPPEDYALVSFPSLPQYGYLQVAGDGTWDLLNQRSMVHYRDSSAPGQPGNVIIAFHREAEFEHIDQLATGGTVDVQDRSCHVWHYRVTEQTTVRPDDARPFLTPTSGRELTLVTCTPWYVDTARIVWRAELMPGQA